MNRTSGCATLGAVALVAVLGGTNVYLGNFYNERWRTCTVTGKDRGQTENSSNYRVYTANCGVFKDTDLFLRGKNNSADIYGQIQPGRTYRFHVVGARMGLGSHFPNILQVREGAS
jgi:hypothetical protein